MLISLVDKLRYSRFEFRPLPIPCIPKGPDFSKASKLPILLAGNKLELKLPKHAPRRNAVQQRPKGDVVFEGVSRKAAHDVMGDDRWVFFQGMFREWCFNGPWFSGPAGSVGFSLKVIKSVNPDDGLSYFHPSVFEYVLSSYLNSRYGHQLEDYKPIWQAPVNWARKDDLPVPAACFEILPSEQGAPKYSCVFPVGSQLIAEICFSFIQGCSGYLKEKDQKISRAPMWELVNNILDSMTLTLSPENQAKVDKIKAECPDYQLSETFPPLKWPVDGNATDQSPEPLKIRSS